MAGHFWPESGFLRELVVNGESWDRRGLLGSKALDWTCVRVLNPMLASKPT